MAKIRRHGVLLALLLALGCTESTRVGDAGGKKVVKGRSASQAKKGLEIKPEVAPPPHGVLPASPQQQRLDQATDEHFGRKQSTRVYVQLDKPLYQPGETVWVRTLAVRPSSLTAATPESAIQYQLVSPKGTVVMEKRVKTQAGVGFNDFELPAEAQGGEYTIKVTPAGGAEVTRTFIVNAYEPPRYKKKLEFLKKAYGAGDTVAASVEVKRPTGEPFANRLVTAVLTLDGTELPRVKLQTNTQGSAVARVKLPGQIERGDGILTILVADAGVTESITKRVPIVLKKIKLSLYPEGGDLVAGLPSRVYFAAQNMINKPADIQGKVLDDHGLTVTTFSSVRDGLGRFALTPATGRSYQVVVTKPVGVVEQFSLPAALEAGCTLRTYDDPLGREPTIRMAIHCSEARTVVAVAVLREQRLGSATAKVEPGRPAVIHLSLSKPEAMGVARVTVMSDTLEPLAERLVFRNWNRGLKVTIKPDRQSYTPRGQVVLDVETRDLKGQPVAAELGLAVVDDTVLSYADDKTGHLIARLMLEAEIPGKVHEPNWYFKPDKPKAPLALELLLGTRGWRKFAWREVLNPPSIGLGNLANIGRGGGGRGFGGIGFARGRFNQGAGGPKRRRRAPRAAMEGAPRPVAAAPQKHGPLDLLAKAPAAPPAAKPGPVPAGRKPMELPRAKGGALKVAAQPDPARVALARNQAAKAEAEPAADEPARPIVRAEAKERAKRKGLLAIMGGKDQARRRLNEIMAGEKRADGDMEEAWAEVAQKRRQVTWAKVRVFPVPSYTPGYDGPRTDFRETIYWNPSVKTDQSGKTKVSFPVSDAVTSFRITAEGIATGGLAGRAEKVITSKLPFHMQVKLPLEVSIGDQLDLPLTLKNEGDRDLPVGLRTTFGPALTLSEQLPGALTLGGGQGQTQFYQLKVASHAGPTEVAFAATAQGLKDEFVRSLKVVPAGFPRTESVSGMLTKSLAHTFNFQGATPGSISVKATFYPSPMATMLTGLDSILREPCGCFEQASSSNYPNIMVMRYMQENNVAKPALLARSSRLLDKGYKKIASYESKGRGYEWFGGNPGHEALTAYGLMEFADMKAVYGGVEEAMVKRTAGWLYGRRDGKGSFQRNARALDSFGRASQEVTNAYIVFALTEAGFKDIKPELDAVATVARRSDDPYVVALATRAAFNVDQKGATGATLARKLAGMQKPDGSFHGTTHSITRSGGTSLDVETTSLAIMALLAAGTYPTQIRHAVKWLANSRSGHGGFGSTQATILALKALVAYDAAAKQARAGGEIAVVINGQEVARQRFEKGHLDPIVIKDLGKGFKPGENTMELRLTSTAPLPFTIGATYYTTDPASSPQVPFKVTTSIAKNSVKMGETVRVTATLESTSDEGQPMTLIRLGIPGGFSFQTWQLKELREKKLIDFYETRPREVIFYFRSLPPRAKKELAIDLTANVPGVYTAPASSAYLYYTAEHKAWASPLKAQITRP